MEQLSFNFRSKLSLFCWRSVCIMSASQITGRLGLDFHLCLYYVWRWVYDYYASGLMGIDISTPGDIAMASYK